MMHIPNFLNNNKENNIDPENKKENELDNNDRLILINKKLDENIIDNIYSNIILDDKFFNNNDVTINEYVFNDIELLEDHYSNAEKSIFSKLNLCKTKIGSLILKKLLLNPICDIDILNKRQKTFIKLKNIKNELSTNLEKISEIENDIMWFWNNPNLKHIELMNDLIYFNYDFIPIFNCNEILNNNEKALLITNIYKIIIAPLLTILTPLLSLLLPLVLLFYMKYKTNINISFSTIFSQYFKTLFGHDTMGMIFKNPTKAMLASFVTKGLYLFMYFQNIYYSFQNARNTNKIINLIHEKLNKIKEYTIITNNIYKICINNQITDVNYFIHNNYLDKDLTTYSDYFNFPVFDKIPNLFSNKGKILKTFKTFKENKNNFINLFYYIGIIDSLCSIQNLLFKNNSDNPYCSVNYLQSDKPIINVKNIWHPYLDKTITNNTVKNSIDIKNNLLITGPNAAGKSTFIKSIISNIILAQTIGISTSEQFDITPFSMIETYLHIPDSKGSSSLFEAEMLRSREYINKIKNLDSSKFSFIVLDEIFSSTNYVEGFSGAYSILKKISSFSNTLSITTTHYTDLEILEKDTKGKIINYKFDIQYKDQDILFNYKIKKGVSRQYIALDLLKNNDFDEEVIEEALNICKKIKNKKLLKFNKKQSKVNKV